VCENSKRKSFAPPRTGAISQDWCQPRTLVRGSGFSNPRERSVEKHSQERTAEPQISPLRCASVEMTKGRAVLPSTVVAEQEPFFITLGGPKAHAPPVYKVTALALVAEVLTGQRKAFTPGLKPGNCGTRRSRGLKSPLPRTKVRGWHRRG